MTFDPASVEVLCVILPKDHCVQVPWKYIKVCGYSDIFCKKNLNQRSLTPRWPLTPHLLRSHVWLYPRIIVSKSHENTSKYVDTVNLFAKTWTKGHWPLDDLWPTSVEVTGVTLPKDHCVQVPWEYINVCGYSDQFCKNYHIHTHTYYILHTTYYILHTTYRISDHIVSFWTTFRRVSFWTTFRRDKNWEFPFFVLKMIEYFGNSHVFFTLATKKVGDFPTKNVI